MKTLPSDSRLYKSRIFIKIDFSMEKRENNLYIFLYNNAKKTLQLHPSLNPISGGVENIR